MSKRKKNNTSRRAQQLLSNLRIWSWESDREGDGRLLYGEVKKGITWCGMAPETTVITAERPNNWSLVMRVILWYPDDKVDYKTVIANFYGLPLSKLEYEAKALRKEALQGIQERHIVDVGWLALSFMKTPRTENDKDLIHLGAVTEPRQLLWRYSIAEELKNG